MGNTSTTFTLNIKAVADMKDVQANIQNIQKALGQLKLPTDTQSTFKKTFGELEKEFDKYQRLISGGIKTKGDASALEKSGNNIIHLYDKIVSTMKGIDNSTLKKAFEDIGVKEVENLTKKLEDLKAQYSASISGKTGAFDKFKTDLQELANKSSEFKKELNSLNTHTVSAFLRNINNGRFDLAEKNFQTIIDKITEIKQKAGEDSELGKSLTQWLDGNGTNGIMGLSQLFDKLKNDDSVKSFIAQFKELQQTINSTKTDTIKKLLTDFGVETQAAEKLAPVLGGLIKNQNEYGKAVAETNRELDQVKSRIQYFFSLNNAINLVRRAIRKAFETVKELDKAMTETAVVTDFSISDMWEQLPEYTKRANELGVSTLAAYQAATLYYQQGLKTNEVNALSVETLKMARIAGLEAAEATDRMTNALRGFNMELTEANAQRVDDVYSELAANTASNVDEISTAMTKVASLAHNANMEFETTAAFLAQIIETTRESAETAGTALKTVVARFSEVKKLVTSNQLTGQDEEGQVIDVNRVGQALRTAGIDLNKYFLGEVGLDDIFMELASKWDSLTSVQQRYIATQAAGSRQQSRFIALMSDYARTQELVQKAYDSNGASAEQFAKTQDSLESALNRLSNAWKEFTMNLANHDAINGVVTALTKLLEVVNKITGVFGGGWRSVITGALAFGGIIAGGKTARTAFAANKIAGANRGISWAEAFKKQWGRNPYLYNQSTGELVGEPGDYATGERFHLFGKGGYFNHPTKGGQRRTGGGMAAIGMIGSMAGSAITENADTLSKSLNKSQKEIEKTGKVISTLGNTASVAGSLLMAIPGPVGIVAAALAGLVGVIIAFRGETQGEIFKRLQQETQDAEEAATNASNAYDQLINKVSSHNYLLDQILSLKEGTLEFQKAILDANAAAQDLINTYGLGIGAYNIDEKTGLITFNQSAIQEVQQQQLNGIKNSQDRAAIARLSESSQSASQTLPYYGDISDLEKNLLDLGETERKSLRDFLTSDATAEMLTQDWNAQYLASRFEFNSKIPYDQLVSAAVDAGTLEAGEIDPSIINKGIADYVEKVYNGQLSSVESLLTDTTVLNDYRSVLTNIAGNLEDPLTNLAIEQLTRDMNPLDYNKQYQQLQKDYTKKSNKAIEEEAEKKLTPYERTNMSLEQQRTALAQIKMEEELKKALQNTIDELKDNTGSTENNYKDYRKLKLKELKGNYESNADNALWKLANSTAQRSIANVQGTLAKFTNLDILPNYSAYTIDQIDQIGKVAENFGTSFGERTASVMVSKFNDAIRKDNLDIASQISDFSFSGELATDLAAIKNMGNEFADAYRAAFTDIGGDKGIFESFYYNQREVLESLEKAAGETKEITGDSILSTAEDCQVLADTLEVSSFNAAGLAKILTEINLGNLNVSGVTESLLQAVSLAEQVNQIVSESKHFLDTWQEKESGDIYSKWFQTGSKSITDALGNGRWNDDQARQYMQKIFGTDFLKEYNNVLAEADKILDNGGKPEEALKHIQDSFKDELTLFKDLGEADNLDPLYKYLETHGDYNKKLADYGITFEDGVIQFADSITSAEEAVARLKEAGLDEDVANLMVSDYLQRSLTAKQEWGAEAAKEGLAAFDQAIKDGTAILQGDLDAYESMYGEFLEGDWQEKYKKSGSYLDLGLGWAGKKDAYKQLEDALGKQKSNVSDYLYKQNAIYQQTSKNGEDITDGKKFIDVDSVTKAFERLGATEAQARDLAQQYFDSLKNNTGNAEETIEGFAATFDNWSWDDASKSWKKTKEYIADANGEIQTFKTASEAAAAAAERTQQAQAEMQAKILATEIGKVLKDTTVNIKYNTDDYKDPIKDYNPTVTVKYKYINPPKNLSGALYQEQATGGIVKSFAKGSENFHVQPGTALTGEEGPELIWNKNGGYAYLTGKNGPEFQNLQPGDRVFNASETKKIFKNSNEEIDSFAKGGLIPSYDLGAGTHTLPGLDGGKKKKKGSGGGSGSGSDKDDEWKNDLDWLYNVMENIAELERQQNIYQEEYEDLLKDQTKTGQDLYKMLIKQLGNLYAQLDHQTYTLERREQEMREFMDTTNDQDEYLWYNWEDRTIEIDWDAIDKITDQEKYDHIKDLISEAEEIQDKMDDAEDAIIDVENQIQELENIWRDTFIEFEERVLDAIVKMYQTVIDNYSELNNTLNETNTNILDAINKEISLQRQIRDNTKTEEEIADNEAQLAYLQRDTTGGNALDILQRGKDLDEQREDYQDTLIDQAIQKLQEDNNAAAQQREKQIEIMQAQLDYQAENGEFNAYIRELMESAIDSDGHLATDSDLYRLLAEQENIDAMTATQREVWEEELDTTFKQVVAELLQQQGEAEGSYFTAVTAAFNGISDTFDKAFHGSYSQGGVYNGTKRVNKKPSTSSPEVKQYTITQVGDSLVTKEVEKGKKGITLKAARSMIDELNKKNIRIFATGGLATQTGPAWLDGTPSEPEYVLNARQTDAFLKLADVLPAAMNTSGQNVSNTFGATTNNVVINVDKIDSDYSVDQMVNRVKEKLFESGSYRNNNVLSLMR